jgi:hypothetical protein
MRRFGLYIYSFWELRSEHFCRKRDLLAVLSSEALSETILQRCQIGGAKARKVRVPLWRHKSDSIEAVS